MHRIAIGDPQGISHELFAKLRIWMVDGESGRQELYPRGYGSLGLTGCGHWRCLVEVWNRVHVDFSLRHADGKRGTATRKRSFAVASQCNFSCRDFWSVIAPGARWAAPWAVLQNGQFYKLRNDGSVPLICPTCQNVFAG
jgi:hypothetical protein